MDYKRLFLFVEGDDDERFFINVIIPMIRNDFDGIKIWKYSTKKKKKIKDFIRSIKRMQASYLIFHDFDTAVCFEQRIRKIARIHPFMDTDNLVIIREEIESWYLAGLDNENSENLGIKKYRSTNDLNKESFNTLIPERFDSRIDFMIEVLNSYSVDIAKSKNDSFQYFVTNFVKKRLPNAFH